MRTDIHVTLRQGAEAWYSLYTFKAPSGLYYPSVIRWFDEYMHARHEAGIVYEQTAPVYYVHESDALDHAHSLYLARYKADMLYNTIPITTWEEYNERTRGMVLELTHVMGTHACVRHVGCACK